MNIFQNLLLIYIVSQAAAFDVSKKYNISERSLGNSSLHLQQLRQLQTQHKLLIDVQYPEGQWHSRRAHNFSNGRVPCM